MVSPWSAIDFAAEGTNAVLLESDDGTAIELSVRAYQYAASTEPGDWDSNWLVVRGEVRPAGLRGWTFEDASLTTWEAHLLGTWLRSVLEGDVAPSPFIDGMAGTLLMFTEPNLAFSLAERSVDHLRLRVHFSLETRPPWLNEEVAGDIFDFYVEVSSSRVSLMRAVREWQQELESFPER